MNIKNFRFCFKLLLTTVFALSFTACSSNNETSPEAKVQKEVNEALEAIHSYGVDQKDQAVLKAEASLEKIDTEIHKLEEEIDSKWDSMSASSKAKAKSSLDSLRIQRAKVADWFNKMKNSSSKAWEEVKAGFSQSYNSLEQSFRKAAEEF